MGAKPKNGINYTSEGEAMKTTKATQDELLARRRDMIRKPAAQDLRQMYGNHYKAVMAKAAEWPCGFDADCTNEAAAHLVYTQGGKKKAENVCGACWNAMTWRLEDVEILEIGERV